MHTPSRKKSSVGIPHAIWPPLIYMADWPPICPFTATTLVADPGPEIDFTLGLVGFAFFLFILPLN